MNIEQKREKFYERKCNECGTVRKIPFGEKYKKCWNEYIL